MASVNKVILMGRLGQDPELRYTQSQIPIVTLNVATTEYRMGQDGQRQEQTEWHRVVVWRKQAENCAKYLSKGRAVFIEGRLQTRSWEDQNGQKRYTTEIVASNVQFLPAGGRDQNQTSSSYSDSNFDTGGGFPAADSNDNQLGGGGFSSSSDGTLDDIPF